MNSKLAYFIIIASFVLFALGIYFGIKEGSFNYLTLSSNLLLIVAMAMVIVKSKSNKE
jgi:hypothetical protein